MTTYSTYSSGVPAQPAEVRGNAWVDPSRQGSRFAQFGVGIVGFVLAATLVIGQVAVATTSGIAHNLGQNVDQLRDGNKTMEQVIEKAEPAVAMEKVLGQQVKLLGNMQRTMVALNGEMAIIGTEKNKLVRSSGQMARTSGQLATGVAGMNRDTRRMVELLKPLPQTTERLHGRLGRINGDSQALNTELAAIANKMLAYGLPQAKGVRG